MYRGYGAEGVCLKVGHLNMIKCCQKEDNQQGKDEDSRWERGNFPLREVTEQTEDFGLQRTELAMDRWRGTSSSIIGGKEERI